MGHTAESTNGKKPGNITLGRMARELQHIIQASAALRSNTVSDIINACAKYLKAAAIERLNGRTPLDNV